MNTVPNDQMPFDWRRWERGEQQVSAIPETDDPSEPQGTNERPECCKTLGLKWLLLLKPTKLIVTTTMMTMMAVKMLAC